MFLGAEGDANLYCAYYHVSPHCFKVAWGTKGPELGEVLSAGGSQNDFEQCYFD